MATPEVAVRFPACPSHAGELSEGANRDLKSFLSDASAFFSKKGTNIMDNRKNYSELNFRFWVRDSPQEAALRDADWALAEIDRLRAEIEQMKPLHRAISDLKAFFSKKE